MDTELIKVSLFAVLIFYSIFALVYFVFQKIRGKKVRPKTVIIGGSLFLFFFVIIISESEGYPTAEETIYMVFWSLVIIGLLRSLESKPQSREKEEPTPEPKEKVEEKPEPPAPDPKPEKKIEKEPPKTSGPMKRCPYCKGKLSELNFYKLKSGNDVTCEYCGEIISC